MVIKKKSKVRRATAPDLTTELPAIPTTSEDVMRGIMSSLIPRKNISPGKLIIRMAMLFGDIEKVRAKKPRAIPAQTAIIVNISRAFLRRCEIEADMII